MASSWGFFMFLFLPFLFLFCFKEINASDCVEKTFKSGKVCVCDSKSCDDIPSLDLTMGQAAIYTTSHSGKRLERNIVYATDNEPFGTLHVTLNSAKKYQKIIGFGSTFSDASGANLNSLPEKLSNTILRQYFSPNEMSFTLGRVPISSNDFSTRVYSYNEEPNDFEMNYFNLTIEDQKWKIPFIKKAQQFSNNKLKLLGVPWSAPGWMKTTKSMSGYGSLQGKIGDKYHKGYSKYLLKFLEKYHDNEIDFWAISTQNEPTNGANKKTKVQSMLFTAETQRDFIKTDLGPTLRNSSVGKNVTILILDDNRENLPKWADVILNDSEAADYIAGVAVHAYSDSSSDGHLTKTHSKHPNHFILGTEASQGYNAKDVKPLYGDWGRAQNFASDLIDDLNNWVVGWMTRNLVLDAEGGPSWAENFADAPIIAFPNVAQFYKQPMWYSIAHFSRFIQPGAYRIDHSFNVIELEVHSCSFLNPDGSKVIVMLNTGELTAHTVVLRDSGNDSINHYQFHLPTRSIITLYIQN